jgi:glycerol kinase
VSQKEFNKFSQKTRYGEHDPNEICLPNECHQLKYAKVGISGKEIAAIGFTKRVNNYCLGQKPIYGRHVWQDRRPSNIVMN